ncbi:MAG TPA: glycosyltransferase family 9 protein [Alphaproteobacteria bacterium]|nr:glycosyltransferase family 9 protein [Alphaproteobacteria bacterium]
MRLLFITHSRVGDAVLSTGVLSYLLDRYREARVTIACGRAPAELFEAVPGLEEIYIIDKQPRGRHWIGLWRHAVLRRWDAVVDLRASAIAYLLLARKRYVSKPSKEPVHRLIHLARVVGVEGALEPRIWTKAEHWEQAKALVPEGPSVLAVAPTANWRGKMWRGARFAELIERLTAADGILPNARVAVLGAASERNLAQPVLASIRPARRIDLIGKISLLTAFTVLRRSALFIGNDSGLMHLAAAAGIPTLGLFGPSRPENYAPHGPRADFVRTPVPYDELVGRPGYDHRTTDTLMDSLTVDMVENAAVELWRKSMGAAA